MVNSINCRMDIDEETRTVAIYGEFNNILMKMKVEEGMFGSFLRLNNKDDNDNYWVAIKPSDYLVFDNRMFTRKKLIVRNVRFELK